MHEQNLPSVENSADLHLNQSEEARRLLVDLNPDQLTLIQLASIGDRDFNWLKVITGIKLASSLSGVCTAIFSMAKHANPAQFITYEYSDLVVSIALYEIITIVLASTVYAIGNVTRFTETKKSLEKIESLVPQEVHPIRSALRRYFIGDSTYLFFRKVWKEKFRNPTNGANDKLRLVK